MRILKDFKVPDFKFPKFKMKEISEIDEVKVDYDKIKKAEENKNKKEHKNYEQTHYKTIKEVFLRSIKEYADLPLPDHEIGQYESKCSICCDHGDYLHHCGSYFASEKPWQKSCTIKQSGKCVYRSEQGKNYRKDRIIYGIYTF